MKLKLISTPIAVVLLILFSCGSADQPKSGGGDKVIELSRINCKDSLKTTNELLNELIPHAIAFSKSDTSLFLIGKGELMEENSRLLIVGKFIDSVKIYAINISTKDSSIYFYEFDGEKWLSKGSGKSEMCIDHVEFEDLNGDDRNEVMLSTSSNMNGNSWKEVYTLSAQSDSFKYAGEISTNYEVQKRNQTIEVTYEGSWYMDYEKTLYQWRNEKIVKLRWVAMGLIDKDGQSSGDYYIKFYENMNFENDSFVLKLDETYNSKSKKHSDLLDNFFTRKW